MYVDGFQYHYTGGANSKALVDFVAGGGFSSKKKRSIDVFSKAKLELEYERRYALNYVAHRYKGSDIGLVFVFTGLFKTTNVFKSASQRGRGRFATYAFDA